MSIVINHSAPPQTPEESPEAHPIADRQLVQALASKGVHEIADIVRKASQANPQAPSPPSEYVLLAPNGVDFEADHGPAVWSEARGLYLAADGWTLSPFHKGNPHVGQGFPPPKSRDRLDALRKEWHHLRILEAEQAIKDLKNEITADLNRTGRKLTDADLDRITVLKDDLDARQDAQAEFLKPFIQEEEAARWNRYQASLSEDATARREQRNRAKVERLFNEPTPKQKAKLQQQDQEAEVGE